MMFKKMSFMLILTLSSAAHCVFDYNAPENADSKEGYFNILRPIDALRRAAQFNMGEFKDPAAIHVAYMQLSPVAWNNSAVDTYCDTNPDARHQALVRNLWTVLDPYFNEVSQSYQKVMAMAAELSTQHLAGNPTQYHSIKIEGQDPQEIGYGTAVVNEVAHLRFLNQIQLFKSQWTAAHQACPLFFGTANKESLSSALLAVVVGDRGIKRSETRTDIVPQALYNFVMACADNTQPERLLADAITTFKKPADYAFITYTELLEEHPKTEAQLLAEAQIRAAEEAERVRAAAEYQRAREEDRRQAEELARQRVLFLAPLQAPSAIPTAEQNVAMETLDTDIAAIVARLGLHNAESVMAWGTCLFRHEEQPIQDEYIRSAFASFGCAFPEPAVNKEGAGVQVASLKTWIADSDHFERLEANRALDGVLNADWHHYTPGYPRFLNTVFLVMEFDRWVQTQSWYIEHAQTNWESTKAQVISSVASQFNPALNQSRCQTGANGRSVQILQGLRHYLVTPRGRAAEEAGKALWAAHNADN